MLAIKDMILQWRSAAALHGLDQEFLQYCQQENSNIYEFLLQYRKNSSSFVELELSQKLIAVAQLFECFIAAKFGLTAHLQRLTADAEQYDKVYSFKQDIVIKRARAWQRQERAPVSFDELNAWLEEQTAITEYAIARFAETADTDSLDKLAAWTIAAREQQKYSWASLHIPSKMDFMHLIPVEIESTLEDYNYYTSAKYRPRDGFELTDHGMDAAHAADQVRYCIYCHDKQGDFCSIGFPVKKGKPELGIKVNPLGITLNGCPLEQKISE